MGTLRTFSVLFLLLASSVTALAQDVRDTQIRVQSSLTILQDLTELAINEIMYHAADGGPAPPDDLEFIEIANTGTETLDLGGVRFTSGVSFVFDSGTMLPPGQLVVIASNAAAFEIVYGFAPAGVFAGPLGDDGALLTLEDSTGLVLDTVDYSDTSPWPTEPDGAGRSLELRDPGLDNADPTSWGASILPGGTPGARNSLAGPGPTRAILNEYNAVNASGFLKNNRADTFWGRVAGNGGDWFEVVVTVDHLDMRGWDFRIQNGVDPPETLRLTEDRIWSDLRSGTIITISEDLPDDVSYDPVSDDWWINVQAKDGASGLYIEAQSFPVSNDNWQLTIQDRANQVVFGPSGEGIRPASGVGGDEIAKLEENPGPTITPLSNYRDGSSSTFGSPNLFDAGAVVQDFSALRSVVLPGKARLISPTGSGVSTSPTYEWFSVESATDYYLWVNRSGTPVVQERVPACGGTVCSATPANPLTNGRHVFWIQARNASGDGPWSDSLDFIVGVMPPAPSPLSPLGAGVSSTPLYSWTAVAGAADYFLWVNAPSGQTVVQVVVPAAVCTDICATTPSTVLGVGSHTWWVQSRIATGEGTWSAGAPFIVGALPATPVPTAPSGSGVASQPTYAWTPATDATTYYLWVNGPSGNVFQGTVPADVCAGGLCSTSVPLTLAPGPHTFYVQGRNASGEGPWSQGLPFIVGALPMAPAPQSPSGVGQPNAPDYVWLEASGATEYLLWVNDGSSANVIRQVVPAAACSDGVCLVTPATSLANGPHTWWVQGRNASGEGPWSVGITFVVGGAF